MIFTPVPNLFSLREQVPGDNLIVPGFIFFYIVITDVWRVLLLIIRLIKNLWMRYEKRGQKDG